MGVEVIRRKGFEGRYREGGMGGGDKEGGGVGRREGEGDVYVVRKAFSPWSTCLVAV